MLEKQALIPGAVLGGAGGALLTPSDPEVGMIGGALLGAGTEYAVRRRPGRLFIPALLGAGAYLGKELFPEHPYAGMFAGAGTGLLASALLAPGPEGVIGEWLELPKRVRSHFALPGRIGFRLGVPALLLGGLLYLKSRHEKEQRARQSFYFSKPFSKTKISF